MKPCPDCWKRDTICKNEHHLRLQVVFLYAKFQFGGLKPSPLGRVAEHGEAG